MRIGVIGGGTMGSGIAQLAAMHGHDVVLAEVDERAIERAVASIDESLQRFVRSDRLSTDDVDQTRRRLRATTSIQTAADLSDIVIEAVPESFEIKRDALHAIAEAASDTALLATNTSQISITRLAATLLDAAPRFIGLHFFNPPVLMRLVEVVRGLQTTDDTTSRALEFVSTIGREAVVCEKDSPGFITTRAYAALRMECLRIIEEGIASPADVDRALKLAFNLPMGPFELADYNGLDIVLAAMDALSFAHGERFRPTVGLRNTVAAGRLGRKTGEGFFTYPDSAA